MSFEYRLSQILPCVCLATAPNYNPFCAYHSYHDQIVALFKETMDSPGENCMDILRQVAALSGVTPEDIQGKSRKQEYCYPRHIFAYLAVLRIGVPYVEVGRILGGRDHSTICNSIGVINKALGSKRSFLGKEYRRIEKAIELNSL